jgi:hypothetical protein
MRSHYSTCIKPPLNPNQRRKNGSKRRKRNQTDQTNIEKRNPPTHLEVTRKESSRITARPWWVSPRLKSTSTRWIKHPAGTVAIIATTL